MARTRKDLPKSQDGRCTSCGQTLPLQEKDPNVNTTPVKASQKAVDKDRSPKDFVPPPSAQKPANKPRKAASPKSASKAKDSTNNNTTAASLSTIHLDGEETEAVPIYATCDDIRKLLNAHLPSTNKASFSRELSEMLPSSKVTPRNLDALLKMKGPSAGAHNTAFYAAYVFFEKIRVRDNKKKSAKRQKLEEIYGKEGYSRQGQHEMGIFCPAGVKPYLDQYGQMQEKGMPTGGGIYRKKV
ncbi:hypothetical protein Slin15195_G057890 [Septoria linicola]|uniref:DUF7726 domain-containing protein n=1 Tax=Septoria linicola TaxID=215465 RepID=A0A9Q9EIX5_9PEZI|nr:hypothetical protein Slin14017_G073740 [Septoria linicola]USW52470.1 hypothetical protein Slin15195_G057890 [Septoria linicola]